MKLKEARKNYSKYALDLEALNFILDLFIDSNGKNSSPVHKIGPDHKRFREQYLRVKPIIKSLSDEKKEPSDKKEEGDKKKDHDKNPGEGITSYTFSTIGEGDCGFHAAFGRWNGKKIGCPESEIIEKRKTMANAIRKVDKDSPLFPMVVTAIQDIMLTEDIFPSLKRANAEYQEENRKSVNEAWMKFEKTLEEHKEIAVYIRNKTLSRKNFLDTLRQQFQFCLTMKSGTLYALIASDESLNKAFEAYNVETNKEFRLEALILKDSRILTEYAIEFKKRGNGYCQWSLK